MSFRLAPFVWRQRGRYPDDSLGVSTLRYQVQSEIKSIKMFDKSHLVRTARLDLEQQRVALSFLAYEFPKSEDSPHVEFKNNGKVRVWSTELPKKKERPSREEMSRLVKLHAPPK